MIGFPMLNTIVKKRQPSVSRLLQRLMRNTFAVENLEQRILLSANPLTSLSQSVLNDGQTVEFAPLSELSYSTRVSNASVGNTGVSGGSDFNVDAQAFDAALNQTRSAFMDSSLALGDQGYARFISEVLSSGAGKPRG
jgi:hypothetical protein